MALRSVITATLLLLTAHSVLADHCDVIDTLDNQWVNVNNLKNDHDARYLSEAQVSNKEECQQACCQSEKCSVVIYDTKENQSKENCFLLDCSQDLECIFENKDGMVTYVVDKKHDTPVKEGTPSTSTPGKLTSSGSILTTRTTPKNSTTVKSTTQLALGSVTPTNAPLLSDVSPFITKTPTKPPTTTTTRTATTPAPPPPNTTKSKVSPASVLETTTNATTISAKPKTTTVKASVSEAKSFADQNATSVILQGPSTTASVSVMNNNTLSSSNNVTENMELDRNNVTSEELTNKEISQLLNITLPGLQVNDSLVNSTIPQIKRPPISTQSFVPLNSSSLSSTSSSSTTTTTTSSPSSSSKSVHVSTSQQHISSVITTKAANINVTKTTTTTTTMTTISPMLTNNRKLDQKNSSLETSNPNVNDTMELKTVAQDEDKNSTSGGLENKTNQTGPSSAVLGGLIALLCFGMFFIIAIVVIFGKKLFESWQRRHYSRIDYLVNGMYN
ncbi:MANSC domain-containing protein 1-like [Saccostrea cucullata]|uniref:MANSC domain-containing protein 1-like n=1 Tax=Saccostrea cuccullata TaxID=36930 RepID=UPI002ED4CD9B